MRRRTQPRCISGSPNSAYGGFADDTNEQKTVEAGVAFALSEAFSLGIYDYYGTENDLGNVNYLDVVASFTASDKAVSRAQCGLVLR